METMKSAASLLGELGWFCLVDNSMNAQHCGVGDLSHGYFDCFKLSDVFCWSAWVMICTIISKQRTTFETTGKGAP